MFLDLATQKRNSSKLRRRLIRGVLHTSYFYIMRVWIYLKSWEWYGKDRSNRANLLNEKIREINCTEYASPLEKKSASFHIGRLHSPLRRGRVSL